MASALDTNLYTRHRVLLMTFQELRLRGDAIDYQAL